MPMNVKFVKLTNNSTNICVILYSLWTLSNTVSHLVFKNSPWAHRNTFGVILLIGRGEDRPKVT